MRNAQTMNRAPEYMAFRKERHLANIKAKLLRRPVMPMTADPSVSFNGVAPDPEFDEFLERWGE